MTAALQNPDEVWKNKQVSKLIGKWMKTAPNNKKKLLASAIGVTSFKKAEPSARMKMFNERSRRLSGVDSGLKIDAHKKSRGGPSFEVAGKSLQDAGASKKTEEADTRAVAPRKIQSAKAKKRDETLFVTTNRAFQGAVEGDNFREILSWARPDPTENLTFRSQWGDALSKGGKDDWWQKYMKSQYQVYNEEVHGPKVDKSARNSKEFFSWVKRQQLYYNDILNPEVAEEVEKWMSEATPQEKRSLLDLFADLHTVVQPARQYNSTMKADHTHFRPSSAKPRTYNLDKAKKAKAKSRPLSAPVRSKPKMDPAAKDDAAEKAEAEKTKASFEEDLFGKENIPQKKAFKDKGERKKELYKSSVPIAWSSEPTINNDSAYREMCKSATAAGHQSAKGHDYISDFTCPFGTVNTNAMVNKTKLSKKFLVPASLMTTKSQRAKSCSGKGSTTNRISYMARSEAENRMQNAIAARMVAESKKARYISLVPLGAKGITDLVTWKSTNKELFRDTKAQLKWQQESLKKAASSIQAAFNGPTACVGVTAPVMRPTKWVL